MAYSDRRLIARLFDATQPLISPRSQLVGGQHLSAGDDIDPDLDKSKRLKLWLSRRAVYKSDFSPTPIAGPVPTPISDKAEDAWQHRADGVDVIASDTNLFQIKADWLDEPISVRGVDQAKAKAAELRGQLHFDHVGGGYYQISRGSVPIFDERHKGKDATADRIKEIEAIKPEALVVVSDDDGDIGGLEATVEALDGDVAALKLFDEDGGAIDARVHISVLRLADASDG